MNITNEEMYTVVFVVVTVIEAKVHIYLSTKFLLLSYNVGSLSLVKRMNTTLNQWREVGVFVREKHELQ